MIELEKLKKNVIRAGDEFLDKIFKPYRNVSFFDCKKNLLEGDDALKIFNTIGVTIDYIYLMAISNGLDGIDEKRFNELLNIQKERSKNMKPC